MKTARACSFGALRFANSLGVLHMTAQGTIYFGLIAMTVTGMVLEPSDDVGIQTQRDPLLNLTGR